MAFKTGAPRQVERDTHFDIREKGGKLTLRGTTHDGKKYLLADITPAGLVMRRNNDGRALGIAVDNAGRVKTA